RKPVTQIQQESRRVCFSRRAGKLKESLYFRSKREAVSGGGKVQWFDPKAIPGQEKLPFFGIEHRKCEHADKARQCVRAPFSIGRQENFRVCLGVEDMAESLQLLSQFPIVIDFAVIYEVIAAIIAGHGLPACSCNIDDRKAAMQQ